jgi:glucans biosynthesis protein
MVRAQDVLPGAELFQDGAAFERGRLVEHARALAKKPYAAPAATLPDGLQNLNFEQYSGIRHRPERLVWADANPGLMLEPLHRGFIYAAPVHLAVVEGGLTRKIVYSPTAYDYGKLTPPPSGVGDIGYAGVRIVGLTPDAPTLRDIASFRGASFLRSAARGQTPGTIARALSMRTGDQKGEEIAYYRALWIERPQRGDLIVVHALIDSESVTGVFSYTIRIGDITIIDTEAAIFPRVVLDSYGLAGMQASYLYGWTDRRNVDDTRPQVFEVAGLSMHTGNGEWVWRPVTNPKQLQISWFAADNPRGFGFAMRDRDFLSYQDHDQRYDLRPTLWIEPIGDWQAGVVQLVEIPSESETHDNIIAQWRPKEPLAAGSELFMAYRQHWCWQPPERPALAQVVGTRIGRGPQRRRRFIVDFGGERALALSGKLAEVQATLWASNNGANSVRILSVNEQRPLRVVFDLDPGSEQLIELRLALTAAGTPVSETWLYRWTP